MQIVAWIVNQKCKLAFFRRLSDVLLQFVVVFTISNMQLLLHVSLMHSLFWTWHIPCDYKICLDIKAVLLDRIQATVQFKKIFLYNYFYTIQVVVCIIKWICVFVAFHDINLFCKIFRKMGVLVNYHSDQNLF